MGASGRELDHESAHALVHHNRSEANDVKTVNMTTMTDVAGANIFLHEIRQG